MRVTKNRFSENITTITAIQIRDQHECNLRYGRTRTNENRGRLGVCQLQLQPVNIQTSCQSRLRHSKQSEKNRIGTILGESAHLFSLVSS